MSQDFYQMLGVAKDADQDTIKKAYRKMAMQHHPDKNPGNQEAEEKFKDCASAYEVLSNPEKRATYDRVGHAAFTQKGRGSSQYTDVNDIFSNFGDIFGDIFGGGRGGGGGRGRASPRASRGADLRYMLDMTLEEVFDGLEKDVEFEVEENCTPCKGSGSEPGHSPETCPTCKGAGQVVRAQGFFSLATPCPTCAGQGQVIKHKCKKCKGEGRVPVGRKIRVKIPAGVRTGTRLRVTGEGEGGYRGGPNGDLYVEIREKEHQRFARNGDDLVGQLEISYVQALLGASLQVESLKSTESVDVPAGTAAGAIVKIAEKGLPSLKGNGRGHLLMQIDIKIPQKLSKEEEELLRKLAQVRGEKVHEHGHFGGLFKKK